jgi:hypothetical protein
MQRRAINLDQTPAPCGTGSPARPLKLGVCKTPWTTPFKNLGMPAEARKPFPFRAATGLGGDPTLRVIAKAGALRRRCKRIGQ